MTKRKINNLFIIVIFLLCSLIMASCSKSAESIGKKSEYIVIHSRAREKSSGIYCINGEGIVTEKFKNSKMQDLSFFAFDYENLIVSGGRSNNNMLFDFANNGTYEELNWLNEPNYSGVTAVELLNNSALAIMNGNFTETTYLNLLVEQDFDGHVIQQNTIEIYTRDVSVSDNHAKIVGKHLVRDTNSDAWKASIIDYNLAKQQIENQFDYAEYNCFWEIAEDENTLYCLAEDKNESINTICVINKQTFEIEKQVNINDQLSGMYVADEEIYVVGNEAIYQITKSELTTKNIFSFDSATNGFVDCAYVYDNHYYILFRHVQRIKKGNDYEYGIFLKIDMNTFEKEEISIRYEKRTIIDDLLIFPTLMFSKSTNEI